MTVIDAVEILQSRIRQFLDILRHLDARLKDAVLLHSDELIHGAEDRIGLCRDEPFADTETVHACALQEEG